MKLAKPLTTTFGAVALTLVAAASALAVNIGIMSQQGDPGVGTLETVSSAPVDPSQPSTRYVTIYVDDPSQAVTALDQPAAPQVTAEPAVNLVSTPSYEHEYEGAENDD